MESVSKPNTYTAQYLGKWHAGFTVGNQSFVLNAHEGTEEEANWYAEMMDKAFAKLCVVEEVELVQPDPLVPMWLCSHCDWRNAPSHYTYCPDCGNKIKR